jgi:cell division protein ZipA
MDRDTVRLILLVIGVLVIAGIYVWGRYKQQVLDFLRRRGDFEELETDEPEPAASSEQDDDDLLENLSYRNRGETAAARERAGFPGYGFDDELESGDMGFAKSETPSKAHHGAKPESEPRKAGVLGAPFLIQISVVAGRGRFFDGQDLRDALLDQDLVYGEMGIFHRYDHQFREPLFSVASLVEPGTFPVDDMESFQCPGVVLFFQTARVSDPLIVYDDLVHTCHELAVRLGGIEWDENRQPLTAGKVAHMRALLEQAVDEQ